MSSPVPSRGSQADPTKGASGRAPRLGASPQTPLSGRRGAVGKNVTCSLMERPVDMIAVARRFAEETA